MNSLPSTTRNGYCCCVPLCSNRSRLDPSLSFHRFPGESRSALRKAWIHAIRREKFAVTSNTRVCSAHFKDEDFFQRGVVYFDGRPVGGDPEKENAGSLSQTSIPRRLLPHAIPSIFAFVEPSKAKKRKAPTARGENNRKKRLNRARPSIVLAVSLCVCKQGCPAIQRHFVLEPEHVCVHHAKGSILQSYVLSC